MRILVAPDAFKGCLDAAAVAHHLVLGLRRALPAAELLECPVADGGEGTVAALCAAGAGQLHRLRVEGPLGEPVEASYALLAGGATAVCEAASAAGLGLVPPAARDPWRASSYGVGQLLAHVAELPGVRRCILGLGGSGTNDGGAGLAQALGFRLLDAAGRELERGGGALGALERIEAPAARLDLELVAACDVDSPLCGPQGASRVYGPQKGASPAQVAALDDHLRRLGERLAGDLGRDVALLPGAGAAGGLGAGLAGFLGATLQPGVELILDALGIQAILAEVDLVVTGEGRLDTQTLHGKAPLGVAARARAAGIPVVAVAGGVDPAAYALHAQGLELIWGLPDRPLSEAEARAEAPRLLERAGEELGRCLGLGARLGGLRPPGAGSGQARSP